ncbi:D-alanyl-D-alanine carboxypeptidase [Bacillus sp. RG28]|uniref:serine-type D-Ala-D-Ala carboxypeptidase n=1 Tax=Gottfriedia endophytica TaxID=2820819 RepID=A0A940NYA8_9BACI|nr:D-alanyl-D-alanine carboxypeptidase [Gottfriedia endophytica]
MKNSGGKDVNVKKIVNKIVIFALTLALIIPVSSSAFAAEDTLGVNAKAAILVDANSGKILYEKNQDTPLPIASMTKMMMEYIVLEDIKEGKITWDQKTTISPYAYKISQNRGLSNVPLELGGQYTIKELYEASAIYSADGATIALAEALGGSEKNFVKMMSDKADQLQLGQYTFVNATGLVNQDLMGMQPPGTDVNAENYMSAKGVAKLAYYLIKDYPEVLQTASIPHKIFQEGGKYPIKMDNWNWMLPGLVFSYPGMDGLKTGSTSSAGYCFTGTAKRGDQRFISVVMGADSYNARFAETKKMMDYGFSNFEPLTLVNQGQTVKGHSTAPVLKGKDTEVKVVAKEPVTIEIKHGDAKNYKATINLSGNAVDKDGNVLAPVKKGTKVGTIDITSKNNDDLGYVTDHASDLVTAHSVDKANWFVLSFRAIGSFFGNVWHGIVHGISSLF